MGRPRGLVNGRSDLLERRAGSDQLWRRACCCLGPAPGQLPERSGGALRGSPLCCPDSSRQVCTTVPIIIFWMALALVSCKQQYAFSFVLSQDPRAFSADQLSACRFAVTGSADGTARVWDLHATAGHMQRAHNGRVTGLATHGSCAVSHGAHSSPQFFPTF